MEKGRVLLEARNLVKLYGAHRVVNDLSFALSSGEILSLLGPNGAGKSTTVGMLYGAVSPSSGTVEIAGFDIGRHGKRARHTVGVVPQSDTVDSELPVRTSILVFARFYRIPRAEAERRADELLSKFGLAAYAGKDIDSLSGGMKRKLALVRALISRPQLVFLDEPTSGLDPDARQEFWRDVLHLRDEGCAVLLTTHYMEEAERLSDRIILLQEGSQIDVGSPRELIGRHVGREVLEIVGLEEERLQQLSNKHESWCRPFSNGFLLGLTSEALWHEMMELLSERDGSLQVKRRGGSLDDVFLSLTGGRLGSA